MHTSCSTALHVWATLKVAVAVTSEVTEGDEVLPSGVPMKGGVEPASTIVANKVLVGKLGAGDGVRECQELCVTRKRLEYSRGGGRRLHHDKTEEIAITAGVHANGGGSAG